MNKKSTNQNHQNKRQPTGKLKTHKTQQTITQQTTYKTHRRHQ